MSKVWHLSTGIFLVLFLGDSSHHLEGTAGTLLGSHAVVPCDAPGCKRLEQMPGGQSDNGTHLCLFPGKRCVTFLTEGPNYLFEKCIFQKLVCIHSSCPVAV